MYQSWAIADKGEYLRLKFQMKNGFDQAIKAIESIRDQRLYLIDYPNFEAFCQAELGHTRQHINRLIKAENVIEVLEPIGSLPEAQTRELVGLNPEQQRDVLAIATATAPEGKVTASWIKSTVIVMKAVGSTNGYGDIGDGKSTPISPLAGMIAQEDSERLSRKFQHIGDNTHTEKILTLAGTFQEVLEQLTQHLLNDPEQQQISVKANFYGPKKGSSNDHQ